MLQVGAGCTLFWCAVHITQPCSSHAIPCLPGPLSGNNSCGQLGTGDHIARNRFTCIRSLQNMDVVALQAGDHASGAICQDGCVFVWGRNDLNQLGLGETCHRDSRAPVLLPNVKAVHPDRTLRKNKRTAPRMRPALPALPPAGKGIANNRLASWLRRASGPGPTPKAMPTTPLSLTTTAHSVARA